MSDIQEPSLNPRISSLDQISQVRPTTTVQESQKLGMYLDNVLGSEGAPQNASTNLDVVMSGCLNGYLGLGERAMEGLESPLASAEILNMSHAPSQTSMGQAPPAAMQLQAGRAIETLASFDAQEVNEITLGLVPGLGVNLASADKTNPLAVSEIMDKDPASLLGFNDQERSALGNIETLAKWELNSEKEFARLEGLPEGSTSNLAAAPAPAPATLAMNIKADEQFDLRPVLSRPVIEGDRTAYSQNWNQISETLANYETRGQSSLVGLEQWLGNPNSAPSPSAIGLNQAAPPSPLGFMDVKPPTEQLLGYRSIVNNELFGFLDLSSYSQSMASGVNPTGTVAMLKPAKYMSNLINGYYT
jgi:hypothetical protein